MQQSRTNRNELNKSKTSHRSANQLCPASWLISNVNFACNSTKILSLPVISARPRGCATSLELLAKPSGSTRLAERKDETSDRRDDIEVPLLAAFLPVGEVAADLFSRGSFACPSLRDEGNGSEDDNGGVMSPPSSDPCGVSLELTLSAITMISPAILSKRRVMAT